MRHRRIDHTAMHTISVLVAIALVTSGCLGPSLEEQITQAHQEVRERYSDLGNEIDSGSILNAVLVKQYAVTVERDQPDVAEIARELAREGTSDGRSYRMIGERIKAVKTKVTSSTGANEAIEELNRIVPIITAPVYNDSLVDVVNVLAELSKGKLAKMNVPPDEQSSKHGAAERLVGNPAYGEWRQGPSGLTWFFLGSMSNFGGRFYSHRGYGYDDWYERRRWSYYSDVGRNYYGTQNDTRRWGQAQQRLGERPAKKSYGTLSSTRRLSTYAPATGMKKPSSVPTVKKKTGARSSSSPYAASGRRSSSSSRGK